MIQRFGNPVRSVPVQMHQKSIVVSIIFRWHRIHCSTPTPIPFSPAALKNIRESLVQKHSRIVKQTRGRDLEEHTWNNRIVSSDFSESSLLPSIWVLEVNALRYYMYEVFELFQGRATK